MRCCGRGQDADYDLDLTGFDAPEVDTLLSSVHDKNVKEDDFDVEAELQKPCLSKTGDVWHLGQHTVIWTGSCTALLSA